MDIVCLLMAQKSLPDIKQVENAKRLATRASFTAAAELVGSLYQERLARLSAQQPAEDWTVGSNGGQCMGADQNLFSLFDGFNDLAPGSIVTETEFSNGNDFFTEGAH